MDRVTEELDRGGGMDAVYLDFAKGRRRLIRCRTRGCFESWKGMEFRVRCWRGSGGGCWTDGRGWECEEDGRDGEGCWVGFRRDRCWGLFCFWCLLMTWRREWWAACWSLRTIPRYLGGWTLMRIGRLCETWTDWCGGQRCGKWSLM